MASALLEERGFLNSTVVEVDVRVHGADDLWYASVDVDLDADTTYYWQGREASDSGQAGWDKCSTFTSTFTTSAKPVYLQVPAKEHKDGYYLTDSIGMVTLEQPEDVFKYEVRLSDTEDDCDPDAEWTETFFETFFLGDTIDQNIVNPANAPGCAQPRCWIRITPTTYTFARFEETPGALVRTSPYGRSSSCRSSC